MPIQSQGLTNKQNLGSCSMPSMDISGFGKMVILNTWYITFRLCKYLDIPNMRTFGKNCLSRLDKPCVICIHCQVCLYCYLHAGYNYACYRPPFTRTRNIHSTYHSWSFSEKWQKWQLGRPSSEENGGFFKAKTRKATGTF